jgi:HEPN domain-containing protein
MSTILPFVFQEPPDELNSDWTHGVLLVGLGDFPTMEWFEAARAYSSVARHLVDRALKQGVAWDDAHPALFMCRHALELYLKTAIPDWNAERSANGHNLSGLIARLRQDLQGRYRSENVEALCAFLRAFADIDPKAMVFRFPDGGLRSFGTSNHPSHEVWVDFRALEVSIGAVFDALDRVCLEGLRSG